MTWNAPATTVNQRTRVGAETTPGTSVGATKLLDSLDWQLGIDAAVTPYRSSGTKYDVLQEEDTEQTSITVNGRLDYNSVVYLLSSTMGIVTPTAANSSATAKQWLFDPPMSGSVQPQTYSVEQGDAVRARKFAYGLLTDFGYKGTRKTPFTVSGKGFGRAITDNISLTSNPTAVALAPAVEGQFNVYLDATADDLGTTQITLPFSLDYSFAGVYGAFYALNRDNASFTGHADLGPKTGIKLLLAADAEGMGPLAYLRNGTTYFLRVEGIGAQIASDGGSGGSDPIYHTFQHDMAIKFGKPSEFKDEQGIFALEWECNVVYDETWGHAQQVTVTNLLTAL